MALPALQQKPTAERSRTMARVRGRNTTPELAVRRQLHRAGFRYRLHVSSLPGNPDLVLPRYRVAVLVHGCFWHSHQCKRARRPKSNREYWDAKLNRNLTRDQENESRLKALGWHPFVVWECQIESALRELLDYLSARTIG
jgi:DNA mismatch endonuclease (patch repair protein)